MTARSLVIGASGFLGSHVVQQLVARGEDVRVMLRATSSTVGIDGLDVERSYGDVTDRAALAAALRGIEDVYYCVVDARPWLRDPAPMVRTNVEALQGVVDAVLAAGVRRFVFTSSIATIGIGDRPMTEQDPHNWADVGGAYVASRVRAEELVLRACADRGLPGVAMCVANTYGPGDHLPTPHGQFVMMAAFGRLPVYVRGAAAEVVAIDDAARAMLLAADKGRVGERYIVAERWMTSREIVQVAADEAGVAPPRVGVPRAVMHVGGLLGEQVARLTGRDQRITRTTMRLMHVMTPLDHGKAERELGWTPRPTPDAIREEARFFLERRSARHADRTTEGARRG